MPKKNLLAFIVVSSLLIAGWWWLRVQMLEEQRIAEQAAIAQKKPPKADEPAVDKPEPKDIAKAPDQDKPKEPPKVEAPEVPASETPPRLITLGDEKLGDYFVVAWINTRGAGIQKLILPKFQKADENGRPVFEGNGAPTPLHLIEDDPIVGSFEMYHYPDPAKEECVPALGLQVWTVDEQASTTTPEMSKLVLYCDRVPGYPGLKVTRTYTLKVREYHIGLSVEIHDQRDTKGADKSVGAFRYQLSGARGTPVEGEWFTTIYRSPMIGILEADGYLTRDLEETQYRISVKEGGDRIPLLKLTKGSMIQFAGVATQYFAGLIVVDNEQAKPADGGVKSTEILDYCRPTLESEEIAGLIERVDFNENKLVIRTRDSVPRTQTFVMLPRTREQFKQRGLEPGNHVFVGFYKPFTDTGEWVATHIRAGNVRRLPLDDITVRVVSNILEMKPGEKKVHKYLLYHGPAKVRLLAQFTGDQEVAPELVVRYSDELHLRTLTDYHGWLASKIPFMSMWSDLLILTTRLMHWLLYMLHTVIPNYGLSIILLTLIVRGAMFPVSRKAALLGQRMQALAPEIKKVQEKYKDDPQEKTKAVMELYRKQGVSPFSSCLPMLMQLPIFLGLYYCLQESIHFRLASFLWMDNLAAPDMLFYWGSGIPLISDPDNMTGGFFSFLFLGPFFNILPIIAVALMLVQQKLMTPPAVDEQQEMQQKMMKYMMVFIGIMFYKVAAGLCVYFIVSSAWGLAERKMLPKKPAAAGTPGAAATPPPANNQPAKPVRGKVKKEKKPETAIQKMKDWWEELLKQAEKK